MKRKLTLIILVIMAFCVGQRVHAAADNPYKRCTLRGLNGVHVMLENVRAEVERLGLTKQQMQTDVELRLRKAGIRVLSKKEYQRAPGTPQLYVNVNFSIHEASGFCAFSVNVELEQQVILIRSPEVRIEGKIFPVASTWNTGCTGFVGISNIRTVRENVRDEVDIFINAYLAENPKGKIDEKRKSSKEMPDENPEIERKRKTQ